MSSYSYWIAAGDVADFKAKLGLSGFVEEDGKWYFDADTEKKFYLTLTVNGSIYALGYVGSDGTSRAETIVNANNYACYFEFHELVNGGVAIKAAKVQNTSTAINMISMINFAVLPKKSGDGFVYLVKDGSAIKFDDNSGVVTTLNLYPVVGSSNNSIVHITPMEDFKGGFIDAEVYGALNLSPQQLYCQSFLFDIGEDTYLAGMGTNASGAGPALRLVFKIAK